jgi:hypothetical protein
MTHDGWSAGILAEMFPPFQPLQLLLVIFAGWVNRHQLDVIEYLQEENRVLKEHLGGRRVRLTDTERRRLARRAHTLGRKVLNELRTLVTPEPSCDGTANWWPPSGIIAIGEALVGLASCRRSSIPFCAWRLRIDRGGTRESKEHWPIWGIRSGAARSRTFSENTGSILPLNEISTCRGRRFFERIGNAWSRQTFSPSRSARSGDW